MLCNLHRPAACAAVGGQGLEHAGERALNGEARVRLCERGAFDPPGAGRSREFRTRPGQRSITGQPRRGRAMPDSHPLPRRMRVVRWEVVLRDAGMDTSDEYATWNEELSGMLVKMWLTTASRLGFVTPAKH